MYTIYRIPKSDELRNKWINWLTSVCTKRKLPFGKNMLSTDICLCNIHFCINDFVKNSRNKHNLKCDAISIYEYVICKWLFLIFYRSKKRYVCL